MNNDNNMDMDQLDLGEEMILTHGGKTLNYDQDDDQIDFIQNEYIDDIDAHFGGDFDQNSNFQNELNGDMVFQPKDNNEVNFNLM